MARAGWLILKWLIVPAALAAVGYYVIGPRLNNLPLPSLDKPTAQASADTKTDPDKGEQTSSYPSPDVDVKVGNVRHGDAEERAKRRRRRHHDSKPKPAETAPGATTPVAPPDLGGSGGAVGAGGTTGSGTDG